MHNTSSRIYLILFRRLNARRNLRSELGNITTFGEVITGCDALHGTLCARDRGIEVSVETKVCFSQDWGILLGRSHFLRRYFNLLLVMLLLLLWMDRCRFSGEAGGHMTVLRHVAEL